MVLDSEALGYGSNFTASQLQATMSKLLTYSGQLSHLSSGGWEMSGSLRGTG